MVASFATLSLVRFDRARTVDAVDFPAVLFAMTGADTRASARTAAEHHAYAFMIFGLHEDQESAASFFRRRAEIAPWFAEATETWSGVLRPIRHFGEANYLDREHPGPVFGAPAEATPAGPLVVMTTAGFDRVGDWLDRAKRFGELVSAVRIGATAVAGLHSQQSFFPADWPSVDAVTVTFWRDFAATQAFAYGPGMHRDAMAIQKNEGLADRTSFTRFTVEDAEGTWHGSDPLAWP